MKSKNHHSSNYASIVLFEASKYPDNEIVYFDVEQNKKTITDVVKSVEQIGKYQYLLLQSGKKIELDLVYSVDGEISPNYSESYFACDCV